MIEEEEWEQSKFAVAFLRPRFLDSTGGFGVILIPRTRALKRQRNNDGKTQYEAATI